MLTRDPTLLTTEHLLLEPLTPSHAEEMVAVLNDPALYTYVGGEPPSDVELRERYVRQARGRSPDELQSWCNWIIRDRTSFAALGYVQATITDASGWADVAWVVGSEFQGRGHACEAAKAMIAWLRESGVNGVSAHVHPDHAASSTVARAAGLTETSTVIDGEVRWELQGLG